MQYEDKFFVSSFIAQDKKWLFSITPNFKTQTYVFQVRACQNMVLMASFLALACGSTIMDCFCC